MPGEAPEIVEPEMTDPCDRASRRLGEHLGQDVRTGIRRYMKSPLSADAQRRRLERIDRLEHDLVAVSTASMPSSRNCGLNATVSSVPSNFASTDSCALPDVLRRHRELETARAHREPHRRVVAVLADDLHAIERVEQRRPAPR